MPTTHHPAVTPVEGLDEARIAADAARMAAALTAATVLPAPPPSVSRRTAQERFDTEGLPRGLASLDAL